MTNDDETTEYELRASTTGGRLSLAAATLALKTLQLIHTVKARRGLTNKDLAAKLEVSEGRISQILNGDGNLHIATVGRFLAACDFELTLLAKPTESVLGLTEVSSERKARSRSASRAAITSSWTKHAFTLHFGGADGVFEHITVVDSRGDQAPIPLDMPSDIGTRLKGSHPRVHFSPDDSLASWVNLIASAAESEDPAVELSSR